MGLFERAYNIVATIFRYLWCKSLGSFKIVAAGVGVGGGGRPMGMGQGEAGTAEQSRGTSSLCRSSGTEGKMSGTLPLI